MAKTKIEWTDEVWNPVWGCMNDCQYCYAKSIAKRFGKTEDERHFIPTWKESNFNRKFSKNTKRVFVNSMSDVMFWEHRWMLKTIEIIKYNPDIQFIFLTKGGTDAYERFEIAFPPNAVLGITAHDKASLDKIDFGIMCLHDNNWLLNIEPMLEPFDDDQSINMAACFDWIIIGAETGNRQGKQMPALDWFDGIVQEAKSRNVPVFLKPTLDWAYQYQLKQFIDNLS